MRRIDSFISFAMWTIIAISVPVMLLLAVNQTLRSPWQYTLALCLLWLPPALSLGQLDGGKGLTHPGFTGSQFSRCCGSPAFLQNHLSFGTQKALPRQLREKSNEPYHLFLLSPAARDWQSWKQGVSIAYSKAIMWK